MDSYYVVEGKCFKHYGPAFDYAVRCALRQGRSFALERVKGRERSVHRRIVLRACPSVIRDASAVVERLAPPGAQVVPVDAWGMPTGESTGL